MGGLENHLFSFVKDFLSAVGYPGVFVLMTIEGFGIPVPSEVTMPFSGFLSSSAGGRKFDLLLAILVGTTGEVTGGILAYYLGRVGGRPMLERYGRFLLISSVELEKGENWFTRHGSRVVFVARLLPAVRSFVALPAGVVRMPVWRFVAFSAAGSFIWCAVLASIGRMLGQNWSSVSSGVRRYDVPILIAVAALAGVAIFRRLSVRRRTRREEAGLPGRKVSP
jgi:membrane protein DedA with SNARE-associated domain